MEEKLNFDKVWAMFKEDREQMREDRERAKEEHERMKESRERAERGMEELREQIRETSRVVKEVSQQLGGIGNSNGAMAENYFYNSFNKTKMFGSEQFDYVDCNLKWRTRDLQDEYDIVLFNGQSIGIIEVKYDAEKKHIAQTINKATTFRQLFPAYKDFTFYLGLASLSFDKGVEKATLDAGIAVIKQVGDTIVVQDDRVKMF